MEGSPSRSCSSAPGGRKQPIMGDSCASSRLKDGGGGGSVSDAP